MEIEGLPKSWITSRGFERDGYYCTHTLIKLPNGKIQEYQSWSEISPTSKESK